MRSHRLLGWRACLHHGLGQRGVSITALFYSHHPSAIRVVQHPKTPHCARVSHALPLPTVVESLRCRPVSSSPRLPLLHCTHRVKSCALLDPAAVHGKVASSAFFWELCGVTSLMASCLMAGRSCGRWRLGRVQLRIPFRCQFSKEPPCLVDPRSFDGSCCGS